MASLLVANFARVTPFDDVFFYPSNNLAHYLARIFLSPTRKSNLVWVDNVRSLIKALLYAWNDHGYIAGSIKQPVLPHDSNLTKLVPEFILNGTSFKSGQI